MMNQKYGELRTRDKYFHINADERQRDPTPGGVHLFAHKVGHCRDLCVGVSSPTDMETSVGTIMHRKAKIRSSTYQILLLCPR